MTNLDEEIWITIPNFSNYEVSTLGRIRSKDHRTYRPSTNSTLSVKGRILATTLVDGYPCVTIYDDNRKKRPDASHRITFFAFNLHVKKKKGYEVDHIDNNKLNPALNNLQYIKCRHNSSKRSMNQKKTSRFTGACWDVSKGKWHAHIKVDRKSIYLGRYESEIEAANAYLKALEEVENGTFYKKPYVPTSKHKGIFFNSNLRKWQARYNGIYLGSFATEPDAVNAMDSAKNGIVKPKRIKTSQYVGVSYNKQVGLWFAHFKSKYIGAFKTEEQAHQAYQTALQQLENKAA